MLIAGDLLTLAGDSTVGVAQRILVWMRVKENLCLLVLQNDNIMVANLWGTSEQGIEK